jgi:hypothetical protein
MPSKRLMLVGSAMVAFSLAIPSLMLAQQPGEISRVELDRDTLVSGVSCQATKRSAGFHASGALESCALASDTELFGHRFLAGTWVYFTEMGELTSAWLIRDTKLQGHLCKGNGYGGWSVTFHRSGALRICYLAQPQVIQGVPCRKGSFWGEIRGGVHISFHDTGALESCSAARQLTLDGVTFKNRQRVRLNPSGRTLLTSGV